MLRVDRDEHPPVTLKSLVGKSRWLELSKLMSASLDTEEFLVFAAQRKLRALESERTRKRKELFESRDAIDAQRDKLTTKLESQLRQEVAQCALYRVRWLLQ